MIGINFKAVNATSNFNYYEAKVSHSILLNVVSAANEVLEIGDNYIFSDDLTYKREGKDKERTECQIKLLKFSDISEESTRKKYNKNKIGELRFFNEYSSEFEFFSASLIFSLYISDNLFEEIYKNILYKIEISNIDIQLTDKDKLKFGWQPDGSHIIWQVSEEDNGNILDVEAFSIAFKSTTQKLNDSNDVEEVKDATRKSLQDELKGIKIYVSITAAVAIYFLIKYLW